MRLTPLFVGELRYTRLEVLDYGVGGQVYGVLEGAVAGEALRGRLHLTNLAVRRPDDVHCPTLRGVLTTDDGAKAFVQMDGLAVPHPGSPCRVFATSLSLRTGDARYAWLNDIVGIVQGALDTTTMVAPIAGYRCDLSVGGIEVAVVPPGDRHRGTRSPPRWDE